jgi:lipopolysaccharide biosynthesis glycosyltransferase
VQAAIVLAKTIRKFTNLDMVLLITPGSRDSIEEQNQRKLENEGWVLCSVPVIPNPISAKPNRFMEANIYSKLNAWRLIEYKAILLLDLDMFIVDNPTDIFTEILPMMRKQNKTLGAALDRPAPGGKCRPIWSEDKPTFNAGMLLVVPSLNAFRHLSESMHTIDHDMNYQEQSLLNEVYALDYFELPFSYNANIISVNCEPHLWKSPKIIHFTVAKPWDGSVFSLSSDHPLACMWQGVRPYCDLWRLVHSAPASFPAHCKALAAFAVQKLG